MATDERKTGKPGGFRVGDLPAFTAKEGGDSVRIAKEGGVLDRVFKEGGVLVRIFKEGADSVRIVKEGADSVRIVKEGADVVGIVKEGAGVVGILKEGSAFDNILKEAGGVGVVGILKEGGAFENILKEAGAYDHIVKEGGAYDHIVKERGGGVRIASVDDWTGDQDEFMISPEHLEALEKAALELSVVKLKEASDLLSAAGCFSAARQVSKESEPMLPMFVRKLHALMEDALNPVQHRMNPRAGTAASRVALGMYRGTAGQVRALHKATRNLVKLNPEDVDRNALKVYEEVRRTSLQGDNKLSLRDVVRVLKADANVTPFHPDDVKVWRRVKMYSDGITAVAGLCAAGGAAAGAGYTGFNALRSWNTSFPMSDLPEDWLW